MKCIAVILSGGTGSRMNMDIPKQYIEVADRMIITESIRPFMECGLVSGIHIVADSMWHEKILEEYRVISGTYLGECNLGMDENLMVEGTYKFSGFSLPGENRQLSILNALRDIADACEDEDIVIIHDAARPLVTTDMIRACISAIYGNHSVENINDQSDRNEANTELVIHDGVMPVLPMKDTVYYSEDGKGVTELLNRDKIFAGQAPEVFRVKKYLKACEALLPDKIMDIRGSTEPAIMADMDIVMIPGDEKNFKITTHEDLERYREWIQKVGSSV